MEPAETYSEPHLLHPCSVTAKRPFRPPLGIWGSSLPFLGWQSKIAKTRLDRPIGVTPKELSAAIFPIQSLWRALAANTFATAPPIGAAAI